MNTIFSVQQGTQIDQKFSLSKIKIEAYEISTTKITLSSASHLGYTSFLGYTSLWWKGEVQDEFIDRLNSTLTHCKAKVSGNKLVFTRK